MIMHFTLYIHQIPPTFILVLISFNFCLIASFNAFKYSKLRAKDSQPSIHLLQHGNTERTHCNNTGTAHSQNENERGIGRERTAAAAAIAVVGEGEHCIGKESRAALSIPSICGQHKAGSTNNSNCRVQ